ncbi:MAG: TlpA family protein disulfide reductase [Hyphomicrobiaceae bacterium]|nr:TlpA family protein disulfide reductase [Hyphomicrobiaceae bacterium]
MPQRLMQIVLLLSIALLTQPVNQALSKETVGPFPFFEQQIDGLYGPQKSLSAWRGKVIVANFWASWCGPCQFEIPRFIKWQHQFQSKGLQIVGIGLDTPKKLKNVARSLGIDYPLLVMSLDDGRPILHQLGNDQMMIPFTLVINKDGTIAYKHKGLIGQDEFDIMIAPLLE